MPGSLLKLLSRTEYPFRHPHVSINCNTVNYLAGVDITNTDDRHRAAIVAGTFGPHFFQGLSSSLRRMRLLLIPTVVDQYRVIAGDYIVRVGRLRRTFRQHGVDHGRELGDA
jgi:hypothetical protein